MKDYFNTRDSYKLYKISTEAPVSVGIFMHIVNGYMKFLVRKLLAKGEVRLPEGTGVLRIQGRKPEIEVEEDKIKGLAPDWASTNALWEEDEEAKKNKQIVYHFNEETGGIIYRYYWDKKNVKIPSKSFYKLKMTRTNKRDLSALVKQGKEYQIKN